MIEVLCDNVLRTLTAYDHAVSNSEIIKIILGEEQSDNYDEYFTSMLYVSPVLVILLNDGYLEDIGKQGQSFQITSSGKAFIHKSSYSQQKRVSDLTLSQLESTVSLNSWLIKTRWWPLIISILGLIGSIVAIFLSLKSD